MVILYNITSSACSPFCNKLWRRALVVNVSSIHGWPLICQQNIALAMQTFKNMLFFFFFKDCDIDLCISKRTNHTALDYKNIWWNILFWEQFDKPQIFLELQEKTKNWGRQAWQLVNRRKVRTRLPVFRPIIPFASLELAR